MPALKNPKHELYARLLFEGKSQKDAYAGAGFKANAGGASRLANSDEVGERITELKGFAFAKALATRDPDALPDTIPDGAETLRDLGLTLLWVAQSYKDIHTKAVAENQFAPANKAIENIHKLILAEQGGKDPDGAPSVDTDRIPVKAMTEMLREIRRIGEGKVVVVDPVDLAKDVTPVPTPEPEGTLHIIQPTAPIVTEDIDDE